MEKPREIAARLLRRHAEGADYVENLLEQALSRASLAAADRALVKELTFGVVRWQATLDWLIAQKTDGRVQKPALQILLRLGIYQLFWLDRIPAHAAVHESVEMAKSFGLSAQTGFINAILRNFLREKSQIERKLEELKRREPALGYSHPDWLVTRWRERWGEEKLHRLLEWNNTPPPTYARLNTLKTDSRKLSAQWQTEGVQFAARNFDWADEALVFELQSHPPLTTLPSFQQGLFYIQDPSTLLAVRMLNPQPGQHILDLCAAPGGKTTFIAQEVKNHAQVMAQDISSERLALVRENCARLGVTCVQMDLALALDRKEDRKNLPAGMPTLPVASATARREDSHRFDAILVDAPCSNTGVMRRRVDLRWRIRSEELDRLRRSQFDLLATAARQIKKGGTIIYSTCSLEPEENEHVIKEFLAAHPPFMLASDRTLLPFVEGVDGAYAAAVKFHATA